MQARPVLTTHMIVTVMLLAIKLTGRCKTAAIEWGLMDPDTGNSLLSYQHCHPQLPASVRPGAPSRSPSGNGTQRHRVYPSTRFALAVVTGAPHPDCFHREHEEDRNRA